VMTATTSKTDNVVTFGGAYVKCDYPQKQRRINVLTSLGSHIVR
jgi:hypothetical protein